MKQDGIYRREFFQHVIDSAAKTGISFMWFITFETPKKILPAMAEADLMQSFYDKFHCLPVLNKSF